MDSYTVKLSPRARRDLDGIYSYIVHTFLEPGTAEQLIDAISEGILSLEELPYRCSERKRGIYANKGYRQLFVKNYTVIYRIDEPTKSVIITCVTYSRTEK